MATKTRDEKPTDTKPFQMSFSNESSACSRLTLELFSLMRPRFIIIRLPKRKREQIS